MKRFRLACFFLLLVSARPSVAEIVIAKNAGLVEKIASYMEIITNQSTQIRERKEASRRLADLYRIQAVKVSAQGDMARARRLLKAARAIGYSGKDSEFVVAVSPEVRSAVDRAKRFVRSDPASAIRALSAVSLPVSAEVHSIRAHAFTLLGNSDKAGQEWRRSWSVNPGGAEAIQALDELISTRAAELRHRGMASHAIRILGSIDTSMPSSFTLYTRLRLDRGETESILRILRDEVNSGAAPPYLRALLARILAQSGQTAEIDVLFGGAGILPDNEDRLVLIAKERIAEGDLVTAKYVRQFARSSPSYQDEKWVSIFAGQEAAKQEEVVGELAERVARMERFRTQRNFNEFYAAIKELVEAGENPGLDNILYVSQVFAAKKDENEAARFIHLTISRFPEMLGPLSEVYSTMLIKTGSLHQARQILKNVVESGPTLSRIELLAEVAVAAGDEEAALSAFRQAILWNGGEMSGDTATRISAAFLRFLITSGRYHEATAIADTVIDSLGYAPEEVLMLRAIALYSSGRGDELVFRDAWLTDKAFPAEDRIRLAIASKRIPDANRACRQAFPTHNLSGQIALSCLELAIVNGESVRAKGMARDISRRYDDSPYSIMGQARLHLSQREYNEAVAYAWHGVRAFPSNTEMRMILAEALWSMGRPGEAMNVLSPILKTMPRGYRLASVLSSYGTAALSAGLVTRGRAALTTAMEIATEYSLDHLIEDIRFNLAIAERHAGALPAALAHIEGAGSESYDARLLKASILFDMNRRDEALRILSSDSTRSPVTQLNYAIMLRRSMHFEESAEVLNRLLNQWPQQGIILYHLAKAEAGKGDFSKARTTLESAIALEIDPTLTSLYQKELANLPN